MRKIGVSFRLASGATVATIIAACGGAGIPQYALDGRAAIHASCEGLRAGDRLECVQQMPLLEPSEPRAGDCAVRADGEGWSTRNAPLCVADLEKSAREHPCPEPSATVGASASKGACELRLRDVERASRCLRDWRLAEANVVHAPSMSCFVAVEAERHRVTVQIVGLEKAVAAARTTVASQPARDEVREAEEKRRSERALLSISDEANQVAARWCADTWIDKLPDDNGRCVELRARQVGETAPCWSGHSAPGGLSVQRDPYSFSSEPRECYAVKLRDDEQRSCESACKLAAHGAAEKAFGSALDTCLAKFATSGTSNEGCDIGRPSTRSFISADDFEQRRTACNAECKRKGPTAKARAAADKARDAQEGERRERRDGCVSRCERASERKCEGLPDTGLVGQQSLCLRDALKGCCGSCGATVNTTNYRMCTH